MHKTKKVLSIGLIAMFGLAILPLSAQDTGDQSFSTTGSAVDTKLNTYLESFALVDTAAKAEILEAANADPIDQVLPLYQLALDFVVDNSAALLGEPGLQRILSLAVPRLADAGDTSSAIRLWEVYESNPSLEVRLVVLSEIGGLAANDEQTIIYLVDGLESLLTSKRAGQTVDPLLVLGLVEAVGETASPLGRTALVESVIARVNAEVTAKALEYLQSNSEDLAEAFADSFRNAVGTAKADVYNELVKDEGFPLEVRVEFARQILDHLLNTGTTEPRLQTVYMNVRQAATQFLSQNNSSEYAGLFVRHFNDAILGFDRGTVDKGVLVEVIAALGGTGSPLAARRLTEFLTLINTYTQQDRPYDRQLTLSVLESLKSLRNVESYNALFMVTILNYPTPLKNVAREALSLIAR